MTPLRERLLDVMERGCYLIDTAPRWVPLHWLGCPHGLALWAFKMEERWNSEEARPPLWDEPLAQSTLE